MITVIYVTYFKIYYFCLLDQKIAWESDWDINIFLTNLYINEI